MSLSWRLGVEIELVAPAGRSRRDLARAMAGPDGSVRTFFHPQSEPSEVQGTPVFHNLSAGFEARGPDGRLLARLVDDLTLVDDLDRRAPPKPGWYRVVSDDPRLLRLVARHADPEQPPERALQAVAALFGTALERGPGGMFKVTDESGASVALAAPLPGERERGCEIVTPPLERDHAEALERLLAPARGLGFFVGRESAVHLHFDAAPLCSARAVRGLTRLWRTHGELLKRLVATNPRCRRLGAWPDALFDVVEAPGFTDLPWPEARARLEALNLSKFCDLNLRNLALQSRDKHTVEVRVLPGAIQTEPILSAAALFEALLRHALTDPPAEPPRPWSRRGAEALLRALPLSEGARRRWIARAAELELG